MTQRHESIGTPVQKSLPELLTQYLQRQSAAHAAGLGFADLAGEVEPYDAVPAHPVEPRLAWEEASSVVRHFQPGLAARPGKAPKAPDDWSVLVSGQESVTALAFCLGNYPQLVRDLHSLLQVPARKALPPSSLRPLSAPGLPAWAAQVARKGQYPQALLAVGVLRLARQFEQAEELLRRCRDEAPAEWQAAVANEEAALAWHRGRAEEAAALWRAQPESVPVLFNRGMAALFLGEPAEARSCLNRAVAQLPEESPWHHLGRLYLALAEMRR
jgi:tetratricopeptide (TPR) repeat protein